MKLALLHQYCCSRIGNYNGTRTVCLPLRQTGMPQAFARASKKMAETGENGLGAGTTGGGGEGGVVDRHDLADCHA